MIEVEKNFGQTATQIHNNTLTVINVPGSSCVEALCDNVITLEKSKLRQGICADCYKNKVANEKFKKRKPRLPLFFISAALGVVCALIILFISVINLTTNAQITLTPDFLSALYAGTLFPFSIVILITVITVFQDWKIDKKYHLEPLKFEIKQQ